MHDSGVQITRRRTHRLREAILAKMGAGLERQR